MKSRLKKITASWFRGFSDTREIQFGNKSIAVYGENGSGKSSFVDTVEYIIRGGQLEHLRHEYSGKRQEKGIINTHKPKDQNTSIEVEFTDGGKIEVKISSNGTPAITPEENGLSVLESQRVILRQDEVADFIKGTKGEKYSSLLPLLGLGSLDVAIENLKKIEKDVIDRTFVEFKRGEIREVQDSARERFGGGETGRDNLNIETERLFKKYCPEEAGSVDEEKILQSVTDALQKRFDEQTKEQTTYSDLHSLASLPISGRIDEVHVKAGELAKSTEPLVTEKLGVLERASAFASKIEEEQVKCPSCGTEVSSIDFKQHVADEYIRLKDALENFKSFKKTVSDLGGDLQIIKNILAKPSVKEWKDSQSPLYVQTIESLDISQLNSDFSEKNLKLIEENVLPLLKSAKEATKTVPPETKELLGDRDTIEVIKKFKQARNTAVFIKEVDELVRFLRELQVVLRAKIKTQSSAAISAISDDIARMWEILHPGEQIEEVQLSLPADQDKAIEIGLKFYGVEQMSPRLTLSEGHRNSLGLCIFLAMAKNVGNENIPIMLDDVVVSFDRNHRGRVATLLEKELKNRQVILFTHDREWFIELKQLLDNDHWEFKALMPWQDPTTGIRWSARETTFDDARALLETNPPAAGNEARKIMDTYLPIYAERMNLMMPYLFREKNDHRMAHEFLERIISDGKKCFVIEKDGVLVTNEEGLEVLRDADRELVARGNRASHTHSLTKTEAADLIEKCEKALAVLECLHCKKLVTKAEDANREYVQCNCGKLRWKYGKA